MKFKLINESGEKTFALVFEKGDEVIGALKQFATEQRLLASHFTAIGALTDVVVGFFDPVKKDYKRIAMREQMEVLSLAGRCHDRR
jgi:predicted DNA-binding protein with PD1-like motif